MRPERLKIKNFLGIKSADIDFRERGLFAILGDNGAGKSSILEAIYFVLFGETLRFGNRKRQAINRHSTGSAEVKLCFSHGNSRWTIIRSISQGSQPSIVRVEREYPKEVFTKEANKKIKEIIKVDKDTFLKTILLPQGEITRFISSTRAETVKDILNSMFNMQIIDEVKGAVLKRHNEIKGRYEEKILSKERLQTYDGKELEVAIRDVEESLREIVKNIKVNKERLDRIVDVKDKYSMLLKEKEALKRAKEEQEKLTNDLEKTKGLLEEDERAEAANSIKPYEQIYIHKKRDVERIYNEIKGAEIERKQLEDEIPLLKETLDSDKKNLQECESKLKETESTVKEIASEVELAREKCRLQEIEKEIEVLGKTLERYMKCKPLYQEIEELEREVKNKEKELKDIDKTLKEKKEEKIDIERDISHLEEERSKIGFSEVELLSARISEKLKVGEPCPICGNEIRQLRLTGVDTSNIKAVLDLEKNLDERKKRLTEILIHIDTFEQRKKEIEKQIREAEQKVKMHNKEISDILGDGRLHINVHKELEILQEKLNKLRGEKVAVEKRLNGKSIEIDVEELGKKLKEKQRELERLNKEHQRLIRSTSELKTRIEEKEKRRSSVIDSLSKLERELKLAKDEMVEAEKEFLKKLNESDMSIEMYNTYKYKKPRGIKEQVEELRKKIEQYEKEINQITERIKDIKDANLPLDEVRKRLELMETEIDNLRNNLNELHIMKGSLEQKRKELYKQREELKNLERELEKISEEYEVSKKLNMYLNKDKFPAYLSDYYLNIIVNRANAFLTRFLKGKYTLTTENSQLRIIDQNIPSMPVPISSLSGGEKVLVSLSITMAITELTTKHIDMLFIDEGFSPLDNNNIQEVADQIQMLEDTNKLIGIVTHNQDFASHFRNILKVENGGARWIQTSL